MLKYAVRQDKRPPPRGANRGYSRELSGSGTLEGYITQLTPTAPLGSGRRELGRARHLHDLTKDPPVDPTGQNILDVWDGIGELGYTGNQVIARKAYEPNGGRVQKEDLEQIREQAYHRVQFLFEGEGVSRVDVERDYSDEDPTRNLRPRFTFSIDYEWCDRGSLADLIGLLQNRLFSYDSAKIRVTLSKKDAGIAASAEALVR